MILLSVLFFATALLYASVGFGGGSTYHALLILFDTDYRLLPVLALTCNIIVVSGGTWRFAAAGHIRIRQILPWISLSIPAAWLGGFIPVSEIWFIAILGFALLAAGLRMLWLCLRDKSAHQMTAPPVRFHGAFPFIIGGGLGFLAGITGIGGGIFLAPVLHLLRWGQAKAIAGTCSLFILVNSLAGLGGQITKQASAPLWPELAGYWLLFPAVLIGGQIGSHLGVRHLPLRGITFLTALLILYVALRLLWRWGHMLSG